MRVHYLNPNPNFFVGFAAVSEGSIGETGDLDRDRSFSLANQPADGLAVAVSASFGVFAAVPRSMSLTPLTPYTVAWRRVPPRGVGGAFRPVKRREARLRVSRIVHWRRLATNQRDHIATADHVSHTADGMKAYAIPGGLRREISHT